MGRSLVALDGALRQPALPRLHVIDLPSDVYFGYVREHAYGMSTSTPWMFVADQLKSSAVSAVAVSAMAVGMFGIARRLRSWWWMVGLVCAVAMLGSAALDPYRSRLYVDQTPLPEGPLRASITALMAKAHIDFRDVLVEQTSTRPCGCRRTSPGKARRGPSCSTTRCSRRSPTRRCWRAVAHEAGHVKEARWPGHVGTSLALFAFLGVGGVAVPAQRGAGLVRDHRARRRATLAADRPAVRSGDGRARGR